MSGERRREILLVEDNPADVEFAREALREAPRGTLLRVVSTGDDALAYLRQQGAYAEAARPDLVILDLNLPGTSGHSVLEAIKASPELRHIPVVVLSGSACPDDVARAYELHANCYVVKPLELPDFMGVVRSIESFWLYTAHLPTAPSGDA